MQNKNQNAAAHEERENRMVRKDFVFVIVLNVLLFGLLLVLYFWNRSTGGLDQFFSQYIKF